MTSSLSNLFIISHDGGTRCQVMKNFWQGSCPRKINLFMWLAWKNRILTLDNLAIHKCNRLPTTTFAICNSNIEIVNHLFITYPYADRVWNFFGHLFNVTCSLLPFQMFGILGRLVFLLPSGTLGIQCCMLLCGVFGLREMRNERDFNYKCTSIGEMQFQMLKEASLKTPLLLSSEAWNS